MFRFWTSSICLFSIPVCPYRLSRAIFQHIFSRLAGAQFADFITCLASHYFVFSLCKQFLLSQFTCFTYTHFLVWTCLKMFCFWASSICLFPNPVCPHRGSAEPFTNTFSVACLAQNSLIALPSSPTHILFWFAHTIRFSTIYLLCAFEFGYVCTCFVLMFHSFAIFPPQWAPTSPAEQPWTATQKGRPYHLDLQRATSVPICLSAHIHMCYTLPHKIHTTQLRLHPPVTPTEVTKHLHTPTVASRL